MYVYMPVNLGKADIWIFIWQKYVKADIWHIIVNPSQMCVGSNLLLYIYFFEMQVKYYLQHNYYYT